MTSELKVLANRNTFYHSLRENTQERIDEKDFLQGIRGNAIGSKTEQWLATFYHNWVLLT